MFGKAGFVIIVKTLLLFFNESLHAPDGFRGNTGYNAFHQKTVQNAAKFVDVLAYLVTNLDPASKDPSRYQIL